MLHYVRQGSGKTIVLIHGFLASSEVFKELMDDLSLHFDVMAIDLPGHGQSAVEIGSFTVDTYVEEIEKVLQHEGIEKAVWLGHSLGGYLTLTAIANQHPIVTKAVLLHSAVNSDDEEAIAKRTKQQEEIKENGVKLFVEKVIPNFFAPESSPKLTEKSIAIASQASTDGLVAALETMKSRPNRQQLIDTTEVPILIIEGKEDKIVPSIETSNPAIQKVYVDSGHMGMLEDLDGVLHAIYSFLK